MRNGFLEPFAVRRKVLRPDIETTQFGVARIHAPADVAIFFIDNDAMALHLQLTSASETGDAGTNDGDMHEGRFL
jgi:hypothetical protein